MCRSYHISGKRHIPPNEEYQAAADAFDAILENAKTVAEGGPEEA